MSRSILCILPRLQTNTVLTRDNSVVLPHLQQTNGQSTEQLAAHNLKSILLNVLSCLVFAWPFVAYLAPNLKYWPWVAGGAFVALSMPPMGWKRPHPYSDMPDNRPTGTAKKAS